MITDNIGLNKQSTGENNGKWGDVLNTNIDKISEIFSCLIVQSAADKKILHVLPTDDVGNSVIKASIVQPKEVTSPSFDDIIDGLIGDVDQSYPSSGPDIMLFGNLESAIIQASDLATANLKCEIILHPGTHIVQSDITIPPGVSIRGVSKSSTEINLKAAKLAIKYSGSSIRNVKITGNSGCYVFAQPLGLTAIDNCEIVDCTFSIPFYLDCKNIPMAIDLFVKGCEFAAAIIFVNSTGNIVTLGSIAMSGNYIGKNMLFVSDAINTLGTPVSMMLHDGSLSVDAVNESEAFLISLKNITATSVDFLTYQTSASQLSKDNYHLAGAHGAVSMGSPYPVMENNIYA